jgi:hypothetical protein
VLWDCSVLTWLLVDSVLAPFIPLRETVTNHLDPRDLLKIRFEVRAHRTISSTSKTVCNSETFTKVYLYVFIKS